MKAILILLLLSPHLVWSQMAFPYISFMGAALPNHSYVDLSQVESAGDGSDSVQCHTDLTTCCNSTVGTDEGHWYFPNGEQLSLDSLQPIYESPQVQRVDIRQRLDEGDMSGMYRCVIDTTDGSGPKTLYAGLYASGGDVSIPDGVTFTVDSDLNGDSPQFTLTCISTGGPATTVTWIRDSEEASGESVSVLTEPVTAQYTHTLTVNGRLEGQYKFTASNNKPSTAAVVYTVLVTPTTRILATTDTTLSLLWSIPSGITVDSYEVMWQRDTSGECSNEDEGSATVTDGSTSYTITGLEEYSNYTITVTAADISGSITIDPVTGTTNGAAPSGPPTSVSVSDVTSSSFTLQWGSVDCIHRNGDIIGYLVLYEAQGHNMIRVISEDLNGGMIDLSRLTPSTYYTIKIGAFTNAGSRVFSDLHTVLTSVETPILDVDSTTATTITLSWTSAGSVINSYTVVWEKQTTEYCPIEDGGSFLIADESTSYIITGLEEYSNYTITVTAADIDETTISNPISGLTTEAAPSGPPTSVSVSDVTSSSFILQWGPVDCIHRNGDIIGYLVLYEAQGNSMIRVISEDLNGGMIDLSRLTPSTYYTIKIGAFTNAGSRVFSDLHTVLTSVETPILDVDSITATTITLSWTSAGSVINSYTVVWEKQTTEYCPIEDGGSFLIADESTSYIITGLEEYSNYTITVTAADIDGTTISNPISGLTTEAAPSGPPTSVSVSDVTSSSFILQWGPVDCIHRNGDIIGYLVLYEAQGNSMIRVISEDINGGMIDLSRLTPSTYYTIKIGAFTNAGSGVFSDLHTVLTSVETPILDVDSITTTTITLSWTSAGSIINNYTVVWEKQTTEDCPDEDGGSFITTDGSTSYTIVGLEEGASYTITVTASNAVSSAVSNTGFGRLMETAPSRPPSSITVLDVTTSSIIVQWETVDCIHRNGDITGYTVLYWEQGSTANNISLTVFPEVSGIHRVEIPGLIPSTVYTIQVAAKNSAGTGPFSSPLTQTTEEGIHVVVDLVEVSYITISWAVLDDLSPSGYSISYSNMNNTDCFNISDNISVFNNRSHYTLRNLEEATYYIITVTIFVNGGSGEESVTAATLFSVPSAPPIHIEAFATTSSSIKVQWDPVDCSHRNGDIIGFSIQYGLQGSTEEREKASVVSMLGGRTGGTYEIVGLIPSSMYVIQVAARNIEGVGLYSNPQTALTFVEIPIVILDEISLTTISISWTIAGSVVDSYEVMWQRDTTGECPNEDEGSATITDGSTSYTITGLEEYSNYAITVTASNGVGIMKSNPVTGMTNEAAPSRPPSFVTTSDETASSITVHWVPVVCVYRNGDIIGYSVRYGVNGSQTNETIHVMSGTATEYTITELQSTTTYKIELAAINTAGSSVYSSPSTAITTVLLGAPVIIGTESGQREVSISWSPPSTSTPITGYTLSCSPSPATLPQSFPQSGTYTVAELSPHTTYNCSLVAYNNHNTGPSAVTTFTTKDDYLYFQLQLSGLESCQIWVAEMSELKLTKISTDVQEAINGQCQCQIDTDIIDGSLSCFGLVDSVTYRARLGGTAEQNSTALISLIEDWVATGPVIRINGVLMSVDQNCVVAISDFSDDGCISPASQSDDNVLGILEVVGSLLGGIGTILTLIGMIATCVACIYKRNRDRKGISYKPANDLR